MVEEVSGQLLNADRCFSPFVDGGVEVEDRLAGDGERGEVGGGERVVSRGFADGEELGGGFCSAASLKMASCSW